MYKSVCVCVSTLLVENEFTQEQSEMGGGGGKKEINS